MQLNSEYVAAHMGNQIQLHSLGESVMENRESILLPQDQNEGRVTSFALVKEYLVFSTDVSYHVIILIHVRKLPSTFVVYYL